MMMKRLVLIAGACLLFPAGMACAQVAPPAASTRLTLCRPGPSDSSSSPQLRPRPTARCPYDLEGLYRRIGQLLDNREGRGFAVEAAAYRFGLPTMATAYDSRRDASYRMGVSGTGGWKMKLSVSEGRYPLDQEPAVFVPGAHPRRLVGVDELDIRYDISLVLPDGAEGGGHCMTVQDAATILEKAGWKDDTLFANLGVMDGGHADPTYRAPKGGTSIILKMKGLGRVATPADRAAHCLLGLTVMQPPLSEVKLQ